MDPRRLRELSNQDFPLAVSVLWILTRPCVLFGPIAQVRRLHIEAIEGKDWVIVETQLAETLRGVKLEFRQERGVKWIL